MASYDDRILVSYEEAQSNIYKSRGMIEKVNGFPSID